MSNELSDEPATLSVEPKTWQWRLLRDFLQVAPEQAEPLRMEHCAECRATAAAGLNPGFRAVQCEGKRCGLRQPGRLRLEQEWITVMLHLLMRPGGADPAHVAVFNEYVGEAGCLTAGLVQEGNLSLAVGLRSATLRGELHGAMVGMLAAVGGDVRLDLTTMSVEEVAKLSTQVRDTQRTWRQHRAAALRAEGYPDKWIAQQLGVDPKMIRLWLGRRTAKDSAGAGG